MRRVFPNYKKDYEMACQVMGAMAEEIVKLRIENGNLKKKNRELEAIVDDQGETLFDLHANIRDAKAALSRE